VLQRGHSNKLVHLILWHGSGKLSVCLVKGAAYLYIQKEQKGARTIYPWNCPKHTLVVKIRDTTVSSLEDFAPLDTKSCFAIWETTYRQDICSLTNLVRGSKMT